MKPIDKLFTDIAREHLGIETLEERKSDRLDFHNVSVWGVERALSAAYQAGANDRTAAAAPDPVAVREAVEALERAGFLMRRVHEGDHQALRNLESGARQAHRALKQIRASLARAGSQEERPVVLLTVRDGCVEDARATLPLRIILEDWDCEDRLTGKKPYRAELPTDGLSRKKLTQCLRRL
jgi:hypothetical protein